MRPIGESWNAKIHMVDFKMGYKQDCHTAESNGYGLYSTLSQDCGLKTVPGTRRSERALVGMP